MYIFKNALRCISRSKGRNALIGIIVFVIAISACIGLSIREAAQSAREKALQNMSITATISFDRNAAMQNMTPPSGQEKSEGFDREQFRDMMGENSALSIDEYKKYSKAESVKDFYYSASVSVNGSDELEPVSSDEENETETEGQNNFSGSFMLGGKKDRIMGAQSDFTLTGYSEEDAMTAFSEDGTSAITSGEIFKEGTQEYSCIISEELAAFNDITAGDSIIVSNPNNEEEIYTLTVCGIYSDSSANENSFSMMGMTSTDPANKIYMSYNALKKILDASAKTSTTVTDDRGREFETSLSETVEATYLFSNLESYEAFEEQVREMGLNESYTVFSDDITAFENSLTPLATLSKTAGYFLIVILVIGAIILIVLNIFSVRERKYEIGVLTAMGMKKGKVALQFLTEIFVISMAAVVIGATVGAAASVPVANTLLEGQIQADENRSQAVEESFGRGGFDKAPDIGGQAPTPQGGKGFGGKIQEFFGETVDYVDEISSATNVTVLLQMLGIAVVLTLVAGAASMLFIMRYEPLKILSNRD